MERVGCQTSLCRATKKYTNIGLLGKPDRFDSVCIKPSAQTLCRRKNDKKQESENHGNHQIMQAK